MAVENVRIFSLETRGVETVKELKEQIRELRKNLVQLDETSEEYEKQVKDLTNAEETLERVMKSNSKQTVAATGSYNALVEEMSALKRVWREVNTEAERAKIGKRIAEINVQLKEMDASLGNFQRNVGNYEGALRAVFKTPQQEIKALRQQLAQLEEGTKEYNDTFMRMADLTTKVQKQQELLKYSSADLGNILGNLAGVAGGVVGGLSAINAAMGLMGGESEDVQAAMLKVQRMMALVQGLSAMEGLGDKINGLFNGIKRFIEGFRGGTAAVADFDKATKEAAGTTEQVTTELTAEAHATQSAGAAAAEANPKIMELRANLETLKLEAHSLSDAWVEEVRAIQASTMSDEEKAVAIQKVTDEYREQDRVLKQRFKQQNHGLSVEQAAYEAQYRTNRELVKTNNIFKLYKQNVKGAGDATIFYSAASKAAAVGTKILTGAVNALGVALKAIGIGLLIAGLTALISLLGKALKPLWDWVTGTKAAKEATDQLKQSTEALNQVLEDREEELDFETRLMEAQGKEYDEIYKRKKQALEASRRLAQMELAEAEATAIAIGQKKLGKKKYDEFRESLEKLRETVKNLSKELDKLDQEKIIHDAQEETNKRNNKGGGGGGGVDTRLKEAERLYKTLMDWYKTDRQKLKETYEENKKTLQKYIKDKAKLNKALIALDQQYYADLKKLMRDNWQAIYTTYLSQQQRRLALMDVWGDKYLERALQMLEEEYKINKEYAAKKVGFEEKSEAQIANMDAATKREYLQREKLYHNELFLIEKEYQKNYDKIVAEHNTRQIEEGRRLIEIKKENAKTDEEVLQAEIELAEYDLATVFQKEGESANEYQLRVIALVKALEELQKKQKEVGGEKDWTQLRLDNDAEAARINNGDQSMQYLQARLKAAQYFYDNLKQLEGESMEEYRQRTLEALSDLKDAEQAILQQRFNNYSDLANGIGDIFGSIADLYQTEIEAQKDADGQYNAESRKKFEWVKRLQIAQATIQTISGAIAAFMGCQSLGQPWGAIIGAVQAAAVTAAGIAEIAKIKSTKLDGSGGGSSNSTRYAVATPSITDYVPQGTTNLTGGQETQDLANALSKTPIKAFVVESDVTAKQELANRRTSETTF